MKLGEILTHRKGYITIDDSQVYKLCRVQLHRKGVVLREAILGEKIKTKKQQVCKRGDFIVAEMDAKVGGYGFISDDLEGAIVSSHYFLFELNEKKVDRGYFTILVKFGFFQSQIKAVGSTNYAAVRPSDVLNWEVPVPGLKEQEQIKNRIEAVARDKDILVSEMDTQLTLLTALRQSILTEAVQGRLTAQWRRDNPAPEHARELLHRIATEKARLIREKKIGKEKPLPPVTEEEMPYAVPEGWVWCRLQDLVNVGTGSTPSKANPAFYSGNIPWYTSSASGDLFAKPPEQFISELALRDTNCKIFPAGSLIIAMYGQGKTRGQISELVLPGATNQALAAMVFFESSAPVKCYIKYYFRKIYHEIRELAEGGAQPNLNVLKIKSTIIPLPPLPEQHAIVQKVSTLLAYCDELEQQLRQSRSDLDVLMQAVLGEVFGAGA